MTEHNPLARPTTRRVLFAGAGAVGTAALVAACGDDDDTAGKARSGPVVLGKKSDIPVNGGVIYGDEGVVVTQPTEGQFKGFSSVCTHQGCPVASISDGLINCTCHGSAFSIVDGSVKRQPANRPLPAVELKIEGDTISLP